MPGFWLLAAIMILIPLGILLRSLLFPKTGKYTDEKSVDVMIYQARTAEMEDEVKNGVLEGNQVTAVHEDLKRTLLYETEGQTDAVTGRQTVKREYVTAGLLTLLLPLIAISVYLVLGIPGFDKQSHDALISDVPESMQSVEEMVERLATRLQNEPDDQQGWYMLAKSYMVLGQYNEAANAYEHLNRIADAHPEILLGYANALALANSGRTAGKPEQLAQRALAMDPGNSNGLWIVGMAAFEQGDFHTAVDSWNQILGQLEQDSTSYNELKKLIAHAEQQLTENGKQGDTLIPYQLTDAKNPGSITVNVSLADSLAADIDPSDSLFIFARALDGPPMPVAVVKKQAGDMPLTVVLDDAAALMQQRKLSGFDAVIVGARISRSGDAMPQPGDLTGTNVTVELGKDEPVNILIDRKIP